MFGDPVTNPKGWPVLPLNKAGQVQTGKTPPTDDPKTVGTDVWFVTPSDLGGIVNSANRTISNYGARYSKLAPAMSTLVCCIGTIGKVGFLCKEGTFNQQINSVSWGDKVDPTFGYNAMTHFSKVIAAKGTSTTVPILNKSSFELIRIAVPPMDLQLKFRSIFDADRQMYIKREEAAKTSKNFVDSLSQRAFLGAL